MELRKSEYTPTIGLEIHAELNTKSKMFCGCTNNPEADANTHICPICMGHPGTLPFVNKEAVMSLFKIGTAVLGTLPEYTEFDRKNYFYPDIPKGYQISQYKYPLVAGGELAGVKITRIHLEEDTARSLHDQTSGSIVDYNRAGVPLMELVTEPVIHDAETASAFAKELQLTLRILGIGNANMEKGEMRVEANISVSKTSEFGTKVEVKNLNSFKAVEGAIAFEIKRQIATLEKGESVVQETRGWDENREITFSQRKKESSHDYRYFPDPDIPKYEYGGDRWKEIKSRLSDIINKTPSKIRLKLDNLGLSRNLSEVIIRHEAIRPFFLSYLDIEKSEARIKLAANYLATDTAAHLQTNPDIELMNLFLPHFSELIALVAENSISSRVAKDLLAEILVKPSSPKALAEERKLLQTSDESSLIAIVDGVIATNPNAVAEFKSGKSNALQFLVGQAMKVSRGTANPSLLLPLFEKRINQ